MLIDFDIFRFFVTDIDRCLELLNRTASTEIGQDVNISKTIDIDAADTIRFHISISNGYIDIDDIPKHH